MTATPVLVCLCHTCLCHTCIICILVLICSISLTLSQLVSSQQKYMSKKTCVSVPFTCTSLACCCVRLMVWKRGPNTLTASNSPTCVFSGLFWSFCCSELWDCRQDFTWIERKLLLLGRPSSPLTITWLTAAAWKMAVSFYFNRGGNTSAVINTYSAQHTGKSMFWLCFWGVLAELINISMKIAT